MGDGRNFFPSHKLWGMPAFTLTEQGQIWHLVPKHVNIFELLVRFKALLTQWGIILVQNRFQINVIAKSNGIESFSNLFTNTLVIIKLLTSNWNLSFTCFDYKYHIYIISTAIIFSQSIDTTKLSFTMCRHVWFIQIQPQCLLPFQERLADWIH